MGKIITFNEIASIDRGKLLVLVGGCFDIFHIGHLRFLQKAKKNNLQLLVALESDATVKKLKGIKRPIHSQQERAEILSAMFLVDYILLLPELKSDREYFSLVRKIKPAVITATEYDPVLDKKRAQAKEVGAKFEVVPKINTLSTSQLVGLLGID